MEIHTVIWQGVLYGIQLTYIIMGFSANWCSTGKLFQSPQILFVIYLGKKRLFETHYILVLKDRSPNPKSNKDLVCKLEEVETDVAVPLDPLRFSLQRTLNMLCHLLRLYPEWACSYKGHRFNLDKIVC